MISKLIYLNFDDLHFFNERIQSDFIAKVIEVVNQKYNGTNILITDSSDTAEMLGVGADVKSVHIHNMPEFDLSGDALGIARRDLNLADIDITDEDFNGRNLNESAERVGAVASHEAGHLFLPDGHSTDGINLMSSGEDITDLLKQNNGIDLNFTELQKSILRGDIEAHQFADLTSAESAYLGFPDLHDENSAIEDNEQEETDTYDSEIGYDDTDLDFDVDDFG